jgi:hypothetical protein
MSLFKGIFLAFLITLLTGCATAPQQPVSLSNSIGGSKSGRIGVATSNIPKADTSFPGAGCLLCYAAASAAHLTLTSYTQKLPTDDISLLKKDLVELLKSKGIDAVEIPAPINVAELPDFGKREPNIARKDFTGLRGKYGVDKILIVDVRALGFVRSYSAYIPTSEPKAMLSGIGYIVNLTDNTYDWYKPLEIVKAPSGNWDEPPKFPGLTNAYFQGIEMAKDQVLQPFGSLAAPQKPATPVLGQNQISSGSR